MKVAEALAERGDMDKRISQLTERIRNSAKYQEGEEPPEDPGEMLGEARELIGKREKLIARINRRNAETYIRYAFSDDGQMREMVSITVTEVLAIRDRLNAERNLLSEVAAAASPDHDRYYGRRRTELPQRTSLPVRELRAEADRLARAHRELSAQLQQSAWSTEL